MTGAGVRDSGKVGGNLEGSAMSSACTLASKGGVSAPLGGSCGGAGGCPGVPG